ncbi:MAG: DUF4258 domain-containing protein [Prolixibacteraceae bacterium]|nr:DUF4258 domain-containing protein [Prolixibacteraceae bacterium]
MKYKKLHFSGHAVVQMFRSGIQVEDIEEVLESGKLIKEYPEDKPHASFLILGFISHRPLHIVASTDKQGNCFIITAYEPDAKLWNENFTSKK